MQHRNDRSRDEKGQTNGLNYFEQKNISFFSFQNTDVSEMKVVKDHYYPSSLC